MLKGTTEDGIKELLQHIDKTKLLCGIQFPWESTRALLLHAVHTEEAMKSREKKNFTILKKHIFNKPKLANKYFFYFTIISTQLL